MNHDAAYNEILEMLQEAELAARNKKYKTSMTYAMNAARRAGKAADEEEQENG